jgi:hypothetical protein
MFVKNLTNQFLCNPLRLYRMESFITPEIKECAWRAEDV